MQGGLHAFVGLMSDMANKLPFMREVERVLHQHIVCYTVFSSFPANQQLPCNCIVSSLDILHASLNAFRILQRQQPMHVVKGTDMAVE